MHDCTKKMGKGGTPMRMENDPLTYALAVRLSIIECANSNVGSVALGYNDFCVSLPVHPSSKVDFNAITTFPPSSKFEMTITVYDHDQLEILEHTVTFDSLFMWNGMTVAPNVRIFATKRILCDPPRELDPLKTVELSSEFCTSAMRCRVNTFDECARKLYSVPPVFAYCSRQNLKCVPVIGLVESPNKMITWVINPPDEADHDIVDIGNGVFVPKRKLNKAKPNPTEPAQYGRMSLLQATHIRPLMPVQPRIKELGRPASLRCGAVSDCVDLLDNDVTYVDDTDLEKAEEQDTMLKRLVSEDVRGCGSPVGGSSNDDDASCGEKRPSSLVEMSDIKAVKSVERSSGVGSLQREKLHRNIEPLRLDSTTESIRDLSIKELEQYSEILLRRIHNIEQIANKHARNIDIKLGESKSELKTDAVVKLSSDVSVEGENE